MTQSLRTTLIAVVALIGILVLAFSLSPDPFEDAEAMFGRGEYVSALDTYLELARDGDARAMYAVSTIYGMGLGPDFYDPEQSFDWLVRSAAGGYVLAQYELGLMALRGETVEQDLERAELLLGRAADQNYHAAWAHVLNLHPFLSTDDEAPKLYLAKPNADRLEVLAEAGEPFAMMLYGLMLIEGEGRPADPAAGMMWLQSAAEAGQPAAQFYLGLGTLGGDFTEEERQNWLLQSASQNFPDAQLFLASKAEETGDMAEAVYWYQIYAARHEKQRDAVETRLRILRGRMEAEAYENARNRARAFTPVNQPDIIRAAREVS